MSKTYGSLESLKRNLVREYLMNGGKEFEGTKQLVDSDGVRDVKFKVEVDENENVDIKICPIHKVDFIQVDFKQKDNDEDF